MSCGPKKSTKLTDKERIENLETKVRRLEKIVEDQKKETCNICKALCSEKSCAYCKLV
jgi:hypothetical protein